ncbi:type I-C CRISPR-associated protein Cas8c/Csd1 [Bifidobacterium callitrichos]|uniref:Type I-C CRISPR-associated protein Cas8c/Csd1 n=1 Tax=Bifidobacterium callitrichos TaxID=762209 RepID=A0A5M9ZFD3_9BIFI|nr:type I-C CRISPR-associated protein Cas8c/Csd1 [Bifidobacterium callitrichos]
MVIIGDLCEEYNALASKGRAPVYGYDKVNVPYGLVIDDDGTLHAIRPLGDFTGKKPLNIVSVPARVTRSSGIAANFLCDTVAYMLGYDAKGKPDRAAKAFQACGELHRLVLGGVETPIVDAVRAFFAKGSQWETAQRLMGDDSWKSALTMNFALQYDDGMRVVFVGDDPDVRDAWDAYYSREDVDEDGEAATSMSLVSGRSVIPAKIHPKIKGVAGAQSSGASLISFNAPAFCSHGVEQNENAPMSKREAYQYTTALNVLLADRDRVQRIGDATVVSWARCGDVGYTAMFSRWQMNPAGRSAGEAVEIEVGEALKSLAHGRPYDFDSVHLEPNEEFHVLALSPNAARLAVRFYLTNTFGAFACNIDRHYGDVRIRRPSYDTTMFLPTWRLLNQTIRPQSKNARVSAEMAGEVMEAILNGTPYPVSLIYAIERRINVEHDVSPDKAAIIKAYYLRVTNNPKFKEVLQVDINEESDYVPYVLGRIFSIYEQIQLAAIPNINTTIKDKYFSSAAATPARIFPILGDLSMKHMRKTWQYEGKKANLAKALCDLTSRIGDHYPLRLSLEERGAFQLGYYFENQKRFIKKNANVKDTEQGVDHD